MKVGNKETDRVRNSPGLGLMKEKPIIVDAFYEENGIIKKHKESESLKSGESEGYTEKVAVELRKTEGK